MLSGAPAYIYSWWHRSQPACLRTVPRTASCPRRCATLSVFLWPSSRLPSVPPIKRRPGAETAAGRT